MCMSFTFAKFVLRILFFCEQCRPDIVEVFCGEQRSEGVGLVLAVLSVSLPFIGRRLNVRLASLCE